MDEDLVILPASGAELAVPGERDTQVSEAAAAAWEAARPETTARAYARAWAVFAAWCDRELRTALPATEQTLHQYVFELTSALTPVRGKRIAPSSVEQIISAIRTTHREHGYPDQPPTAAALRVLSGYRRSLADTGNRKRKAPPITAQVLRNLIDHTDTDEIIGCRDAALLTIGHYLMARRSELSALNRDEVSVDGDDLVVFIRASKTDQSAEGVEVRLPRGLNPATCPIRTWQAWVGELDAAGEAGGRLFRSVDRHGLIGPSLSGDGINGAVQRAAYRARAVLPRPWQEYTAHGLRSGGATQARRNGHDMSAIAEHGRWNPKSPVVYGYVRAEDKKSENVMRPRDV